MREFKSMRPCLERGERYEGSAAWLAGDRLLAHWKAWLTESLRLTESQALLDFYSLPGEVLEIMPLGPWYPLIISKFVVVGRP